MPTPVDENGISMMFEYDFVLCAISLVGIVCGIHLSGQHPRFELLD